MRGADSLRSLLDTIGGFSELGVNAGIHPLAASAFTTHEHYGSVSFEQNRHGELKVTRVIHPELQALQAIRDRKIREAEIAFTTEVISRLHVATQRARTVYHTMDHETDATDPTTAP